MQVSYSGNFASFRNYKSSRCLTTSQFKRFYQCGTAVQKLVVMRLPLARFLKYRTLIEQIIIAAVDLTMLFIVCSGGYAKLNGILRRDNPQRTTLGVGVTAIFR
jgi:iron complex outermembrane receptor protein